jgi:hypothetical protein
MRFGFRPPWDIERSQLPACEKPMMHKYEQRSLNTIVLMTLKDVFDTE